jgi:hypothetical protein
MYVLPRPSSCPAATFHLLLVLMTVTTIDAPGQHNQRNRNLSRIAAYTLGSEDIVVIRIEFLAASDFPNLWYTR